MAAAPPDEVVAWHDAECGGYEADLPVWQELAREAGGPVLDVGAGTGRVSLKLARAGHDVTALDHEPALLAALRRRAEAAGLTVHTAHADARDFHLDRRFALAIVPMQTIQVFDPVERGAFMRCARDHLVPGGLLAASLAVGLAPFDPADGVPLPLPDVREHGGWVYSSQPVALRDDGDGSVIERVRQAVSPTGVLTESRDEVRLDRLNPEQLAAEAAEHGFAALPARHVAPTREHVSSDVAVLRA